MNINALNFIRFNRSDGETDKYRYGTMVVTGEPWPYGRDRYLHTSTPTIPHPTAPMPTRLASHAKNQF